MGPVQISSKRLKESEDFGVVFGGVGGIMVGVGGISKCSRRITTDEGRVRGGRSVKGISFSGSGVVLECRKNSCERVWKF